MPVQQDSSMFKDFTPSLCGKIALVTGSSKGIGKSVATTLASKGATVILHARDLAALQAVGREIEESGGQCFLQSVDCRSEQSIADNQVDLSKQFPQGVDILVNNAGVYYTAPVREHPTQLWDDIIKTNLYGPFFYSRQVLPQMIKKKWGRIINISSISGQTGEIHAAAYSSSKFGLRGLTQSLAMEVAAEGITVNAVCPGWVDTQMSREQLNDENWCKLNAVDPAESMEIARLSIPQMRFVQASEVAELVAWLCSNVAGSITGQSINVCGGMCLS